MKIIHVILFTIYSISVSISQDSIRLESILSLEVKGQHNLSALVDNFDCFNCARGQAYDNPFYHFAIFSGLSHELKINDKYKIETAIFAEERSHSHGNTTLSNLVLYPKILLEVNDTLHFFSRKIITQLKGGDFWNEDVDDIMRFYNIDYHGLHASFQFKNWAINLFTIGDLSYNVGLDLEQVYRTSLVYQKDNFKSVFHATYNSLWARPNGSHVKYGDYNLSSYNEYKWDNQISIKGQLGIRQNDILNSSIAAAITVSGQLLNSIISAGIRYYQKNFNNGYIGNGPRFASNGEFIGTQLYPLKNYYRPYSQWAAYTFLRSRDLLGFELQIETDKQVSNRLFYFHELDINMIMDLTRGDAFLYPFYNAGLEFKFIPQLRGRISVTNKQMELYTIYQTFAASKTPFLSFGVQIDFNEIPLLSKTSD